MSTEKAPLFETSPHILPQPHDTSPPLNRRRSRFRHGVAIILYLLLLAYYRGSLPTASLFRSSHKLSHDQKAKLHEVADGLGDVYKALADLRYIDHDNIDYGPHAIDEFESPDALNHLDPSIVYLYTILPYVTETDTELIPLFYGGSFIDFRVSHTMGALRAQPLISSEDPENPTAFTPNIQPWMTQLSSPSFIDRVSIIYDAREHQIYMVDWTHGNSSDLALRDVPYQPKTSSDKGDFSQIPSRPAPEVLGDMATWYRDLALLPDNFTSWVKVSDKQIDPRALYKKHGWPDHFDAPAFEVDRARLWCVKKAQEYAEAPLAKIKQLESAIEIYVQRTSEQSIAVQEAVTEAEVWDAEYTLWQTERTWEKDAARLQDARDEAARLCPGQVCQRPEDLPLWEAQVAEREYNITQANLEGFQDEGLKKEDPSPVLDLAGSIRSAARRVEIYRQAYEAAKADAERLRPGESLKSATGVDLFNRTVFEQTLEEKISKIHRENRLRMEWLEQAPDSAAETKEKELVGLQIMGWFTDMMRNASETPMGEDFVKMMIEWY